MLRVTAGISRRMGEFIMKKVFVLIASVMMLAALGSCGSSPENTQNTASDNVPGARSIEQVEDPYKGEYGSFEVTKKAAAEAAEDDGDQAAEPVVLKPARVSFSTAPWKKAFSSSSFCIGAADGQLLINSNGTVYSIDQKTGHAEKNNSIVRKTLSLADGINSVFARYELGGKYFFTHENSGYGGFSFVQAADGSYCIMKGEPGSLPKKISGDFVIEPLMEALHEVKLNDVAAFEYVPGPDPDCIAYYIIPKEKKGGIAKQIRLYVQKNGKEVRLAVINGETEFTDVDIQWLDASRFLIRFDLGDDVFAYYLVDTEGNVKQLKGGSGMPGYNCAHGKWAAFYDQEGVTIKRIEEDRFVDAYRLDGLHPADVIMHGMTDDGRFYYQINKTDSGAKLTVADLTEGWVDAETFDLPSVSPAIVAGNSAVYGHVLYLNCYADDPAQGSTWLLDLDSRFSLRTNTAN